MKKELKLPALEIKYLPVNSQTRIPLVTNGTIDIECGLTAIGLTRQQQVDFTYSFYITGERILTTKGSGIKQWSDLNGKAVSITAGGLGEPILRRAMAQFKMNVRVVYVRDHAEGVLALETGRVDAYTNTEVTLFGLRAKSALKDNLEVVGEYQSLERIALMVRRDDSAFRLIANRTLANLYRSGEVYPLFKKHFDPFGIPLTPDVEANFRLNSIPE